MHKVYNTVCIHVVQVYSQIPIRETSKFARGNSEGKTFIKMLYITNVLGHQNLPHSLKVKKTARRRPVFFSNNPRVSTINNVLYSKLQQANFSLTPKSILLSINQELYRTYLIVKGPEVHLFCCDSCICGQVHTGSRVQ
jgi:hypothetical protein